MQEVGEWAISNNTIPILTFYDSEKRRTFDEDEEKVENDKRLLLTVQRGRG